MTFVVDSSGSTVALAIIDSEQGQHEWLFIPARSPEVQPAMRRMAGQHEITKVAVATGPGSFTGLRVGVSFGLGLAMGLRVPIVPLPTLDLQAARTDQPVTAIVEAGRGRYYFQLPGGDVRLGEPADIPRTHPLVGRL